MTLSRRPHVHDRSLESICAAQATYAVANHAEQGAMVVKWPAAIEPGDPVAQCLVVDVELSGDLTGRPVAVDHQHRRLPAGLV